MDSDGVFGVEYRELILAGRVDDFTLKLCSTMTEGLGNAVVDGGIVGIDKAVLDKLANEGGFA